MAVKKGFGSLRGFVNGVLRNVARNLGQIEYPKDPVENLSVRYPCRSRSCSFRLILTVIPNEERMLQQFQRKVSFDDQMQRCAECRAFKEMLGGRGGSCGGSPISAVCIVHFFGYDYLGGLQSFQEGAFSVQDISSILVCEIAAPKEGDRDL